MITKDYIQHHLSELKGALEGMRKSVDHMTAQNYADNIVKWASDRMKESYGNGYEHGLRADKRRKNRQEPTRRR